MNVSDLISEALDKEFEELFQEHYPMAYRTAYGVIGNSQDAEDVAQTIFLKLLRRKFPPELKKNPRAYVYQSGGESIPEPDSAKKAAGPYRRC